jgi:hypothetical protein
MAHDQYCDKDDLKAYIGLTGTSQDNNIDNAINAASREIDRICNRHFYKTDSVDAKYFTPNNFTEQIVPDIATTTSLVVKLDTTDNGTHDTTLVLDTDFYLKPMNPKEIAETGGSQKYEPYDEIVILSRRSGERFQPSIVKNIKVEAYWGFDIVPPAIKQACLLQATRLWKRKDSPFTVYGSDQTGQVELFQKFDPDAMKLIKGYKKRTL